MGNSPDQDPVERKILGWLVVLAAAVAALVVILGIGLTILVVDAQARGRDVAHGAGAREARLEELVRGIELGAGLRHAELLRQLGDLERESALLRLRIDAMNAILDSRGVPPPRQPASLKTPEKEP